MSLRPPRRILGKIFLSAFLGVVTAAPSIAAPALFFKDDFHGKQVTMPDGQSKLYPDPKSWAFTFWPGTKWPTSYGDGTNWLAANGECQTYVSPLQDNAGQSIVPPDLRYDPFSIHKDGLHITAALLSPEQQAAYHVGDYRRFGSGMLLSRFSFTYGKIRMVAKLPSARGSWPALWLLPDTHQWPPEIDIFEGMVWGPHSHQIHTALLTPKGEEGKRLEWSDLGVDPSQDFHEYGLDWTPTTTAILFDGKVLWQEQTPASMKQNMYLIVNLAVGGKWPFNELGVQPIDGMDPQRLEAGANLIEKDYPAGMTIKSISVTSP